MDGWVAGFVVFLKMEINGGSPKCIVYGGKFYENEWFRGTPILGNLHKQSYKINYGSWGVDDLEREREREMFLVFDKSMHAYQSKATDPNALGASSQQTYQTTFGHV